MRNLQGDGILKDTGDFIITGVKAYLKVVIVILVLIITLVIIAVIRGRAQETDDDDDDEDDENDEPEDEPESSEYKNIHNAGTNQGAYITRDKGSLFDEYSEMAEGDSMKKKARSVGLN